MSPLVKKTAYFLFVSMLLVNLSYCSKDAVDKQSIAREWNEALLAAIRIDLARPTVHARNLFHTSVVMYDAWAIYNGDAETYLLGKTVNGFDCPLDTFTPRENGDNAALEETLSFGVYRLLMHRFRQSPGAETSLAVFSALMGSLSYDKSNLDVQYQNGSPSSLGNYLAQCVIDYGLQDGSNEINNFENQYYQSVNDGLDPTTAGNPAIDDENRWQPLVLDNFIDQSGNATGETSFLGAEWGNVNSFALKATDLNRYTRDNTEYLVYHDPGLPVRLDASVGDLETEDYIWGFNLVLNWSGHLDPADGVEWDISPASIGNMPLPEDLGDLRSYYQLEGGDAGAGHLLNPSTNEAYQSNLSKRGDYTRVLAEFWADGPDSETPPGHWFVLLNYVADHELVDKRFNGQGKVLSDLEWDVKSYFILAGAMHDSAITAWGIKGWYDYIRPISAIRAMAEFGQSSDLGLPSYHLAGIPLNEGYVELVSNGDPLAGKDNVNVNKVKIKAWKGPDYVSNPDIDIAGVDWILAENWWPYQRPSFVTPPFAGYISGHSTFSRAAAEVLTLITGDPFFPGGMGEFIAKKNEFLVFEEGPSEDVILQWATYRDASDQTSLSRIWGGIHPPVDDIPGRIIGVKVGNDAFDLATRYFSNE